MSDTLNAEIIIPKWAYRAVCNLKSGALLDGTSGLDLGRTVKLIYPMDSDQYWLANKFLKVCRIPHELTETNANGEKIIEWKHYKDDEVEPFTTEQRIMNQVDMAELIDLVHSDSIDELKEHLLTYEELNTPPKNFDLEKVRESEWTTIMLAAVNDEELVAQSNRKTLISESLVTKCVSNGLLIDFIDLFEDDVEVAKNSLKSISSILGDFGNKKGRHAGVGPNLCIGTQLLLHTSISKEDTLEMASLMWTEAGRVKILEGFVSDIETVGDSQCAYILKGIWDKGGFPFSRDQINRIIKRGESSTTEVSEYINKFKSEALKLKAEDLSINSDLPLTAPTRILKL